MASPTSRRAAELSTLAFEVANPRQPNETAFAYYLRGIQWLLTTPEGKQAFKAAYDQAVKEIP